MNCQACGACCASFRVDFDRMEMAGGAFAWGDGVPATMAVPVTATLMRMAGTDAGYDAAPRCLALAGTVGQAVECTIYASRPGPCREFEAGSEACLRARRRHGLG